MVIEEEKKKCKGTFERMRADRVHIFKIYPTGISIKIYRKYFSNELSILRLKEKRKTLSYMIKSNLINESKDLTIGEIIDGINHEIKEKAEQNRIYLQEEKLE